MLNFIVEYYKVTLTHALCRATAIRLHFLQKERAPEAWLDVLQPPGKDLPDGPKGAWHTLTCCKQVAECMPPLWNEQALISVRISVAHVEVQSAAYSPVVCCTPAFTPGLPPYSSTRAYAVWAA
jgi:hypothetical protein